MSDGFTSFYLIRVLRRELALSERVMVNKIGYLIMFLLFQSPQDICFDEQGMEIRAFGKVTLSICTIFALLFTR